MSAYENFMNSHQNTPATEIISGRENVMSENHNGGISFDLWKSYLHALNISDKKNAINFAKQLLRRVSTLGTCQNQVNVGASVMTDNAKELFRSLIKYDLYYLILDEINDVYTNSLSPKMSHVIFMLAFMTGITKIDVDSITNNKIKVALLTDRQRAVRTAAYKLVPILRTASHVWEWISLHMAMSNNNIHTKGTGKGFRNAFNSWFLNMTGDQMAYQFTKYMARCGISATDALSLAHPKLTTVKKCNCQKRKSTDPCKCISSADTNKEKTIINIATPAQQIVAAMIVHDIEHASKILTDCVGRSKTPDTDLEIKNAINVFAYLSAVQLAKSDSTSAKDVCQYIRVFNLVREHISTTKLNNLQIWVHLLFKFPLNHDELNSVIQRLVLDNSDDFNLAPILKSHFPVNSNYPTLDEYTIPPSLEINMPMTALLRNLAKMTSLGLFDQSKIPFANQIQDGVCKRLTSKDALIKSHVHPITVLNSLATYRSGKGFKGSLTWTPIQALNNALEKAFDLSFHTLTGYGLPIAFHIDASGSMSGLGTVSHIPLMCAAEVVAVMALSFRKAEKNYSEKNNTPCPNLHYGYFSNGSHNRNYTDVTNEITDQTDLEGMRKIINKSDWGCTNISSAIEIDINQLRMSLTKYKNGDPYFKNLTVKRWPGYYKALTIWTDNDVNSGQQPSQVFHEYQLLVRDCCKVYCSNNTNNTNIETLYNELIPKLVVIATQCTHMTVGDPHDSNTLNLSGFDLSAPQILNTFLFGDQHHNSQNPINNLDDNQDD